MAKQTARTVSNNSGPATVVIKYLISFYLFLFFVIYPLYYERKYYNMGEAKWHFFRGMTFYFKLPSLGGVILPSILGMMLICIAWRMIELAVKKEFVSAFALKQSSLTDKFMAAYMLFVGISCILSPFKMDFLEATDLDITYKNNIFLIDGYPRNQDNIDGWNEVFGDNYKLITSIILGCDEEQLEKRLLGRAKTSGRSDDKVDVIKKRFKVYMEQSHPIEAKLKLMGPFIEVKADCGIDEVFQKIVEQLDEKLK